MKNCSVKKCTSLALALSCLLVTNAVSAQELLTNPGFDNAGAGWGKFGNADFNNFFGAPAGDDHASLFADSIGNSGGIFQAGIPGAAGQQYLFELSNTRIEGNFDANLQFGLEFYQADDATLISDSLVQIPDPGVEINGGVYGTTATAPAGTVFVRPIFKFDSVASSGGQRNVFVFDSSLTAVPEPASLAMVLIPVTLGLFARRRRG